MQFEWQCCFLHCWYGNLHQHAMIHLKCTVTGHSRWNAQTGDWNRCGWLVKVSVQKAIGLAQVSAFRWSCDRSFFFHGTSDMWHVTIPTCLYPSNMDLEKSGCELIAFWDRINSATVRFTRKMSESSAAEMAIFPIHNEAQVWSFLCIHPSTTYLGWQRFATAYFLFSIFHMSQWCLSPD